MTILVITMNVSTDHLLGSIHGTSQIT